MHLFRLNTNASIISWSNACEWITKSQPCKRNLTKIESIHNMNIGISVNAKSVGASKDRKCVRNKSARYNTLYVIRA